MKTHPLTFRIMKIRLSKIESKHDTIWVNIFSTQMHLQKSQTYLLVNLLNLILLLNMRLLLLGLVLLRSTLQVVIIHFDILCLIIDKKIWIKTLNNKDAWARKKFQKKS
jgi:hypothetical protein